MKINSNGSEISEDNKFLYEGVCKQIIHEILLHISSDSKLEDEFAAIIEQKIEGVDNDGFHNWISEFDDSKISIK